MQVNFNPQVKQHQNFGMAIKADEGAIRRLTEYVSSNKKEIFKLNELIVSQARHTDDIFLSTDKFNKLTSRVGSSDFMVESQNTSPINVIEKTVDFVKSLEQRSILKSKINLSENLSKYGLDEVLNQITNKMKIDNL